jgi:hypothetical protein
MITKKRPKKEPPLKLKKLIPYAFVLDELDGVYTLRRPMFGAHALYRDEKIVLILNQGENHPKDNGVWVATLPEHHASLRQELPSLRRIFLFSDDGKETAWQNIPESSPNFEEEVLHVCELIRKRDPRVGKVPKAKKPKKKPTPPKSNSRR